MPAPRRWKPPRKWDPRKWSRKKQILAGTFAAAAIGLGALYAGNVVRRGQTISFDAFAKAAAANQIAAMTVEGQDITGRMKNDRRFNTVALPDYPLAQAFKDKDTKITVKPVVTPLKILKSYFFTNIAPILIPFLLIIPLIYILFKMQGGIGRGKKKKPFKMDNAQRVTFDDVAGMEETKEEVREIVDFLRAPEKFGDLVRNPPRGMLLSGDPGNGKTLLAKAVAGEAGVPFLEATGSDFVEMYVGVGARRIRDLFETARKNAPCIIFIDEIDAVGRARGNGPSNGGTDERENTLNELLTQMDGFVKSKDGVVVMAATNRPDILDPALRRKGRFDREATVNLPDLKARIEILKVHVRLANKEAGREIFDPGLDFTNIARSTPGFSGADLAGIINEAGVFAVRRGKQTIDMKDIADAKDKIMLGPENRSKVMTPETKALVAHHEAGHAIVAYFVEGSPPPHKATIIPRASSYGHVMRLPDENMDTIRTLKANMAVAAAGRVGEEMFTNDPEKITTGAAGDIATLTRTAWKMTTEFGMVRELGMIRYADMMTGGRNGMNLSEATAQKVDGAVQALAEQAYAKAKEILEANKDAWERLARALLTHETLDEAEIRAVIEDARANPEHPANRPMRAVPAPEGPRPQA